MQIEDTYNTFQYFTLLHQYEIHNKAKFPIQQGPLSSPVFLYLIFWWAKADKSKVSEPIPRRLSQEEIVNAWDVRFMYSFI